MKKYRFSLLYSNSIFKKLQLSILSILFVLCAAADNNVYYVDNVNGNDNNEGHSEATAWKTLSRINITTFKQGDKILLKRGQLFTGSIQLKGDGAALQPIQLRAYGVGKRPVISSKGFDYSIQLMDAEGWEINDMETTGSDKAGIYIGCTKDGAVMDYFRVNNCYVHNIGDTSKLDWDYSTSTGGIIVVNGSLNKDGKPAFYKSTFNDVVINNCTVRYNHRWTCLSITSGKIDGKRGNANYIRNCTAEYSSADGIRMNGVQNSFIEYCVMYRNGAWPKYPGRNLGGLGAWFFDAENCTIQFSEASHVQANTTDGGAFDIDYNQKNSTVQYCYGHDCSGYGVSVFGADSTDPTVNSTVRYNIFSNNGRDSSFAWEGDFFVYTWNGGLLNGVKIYNNTSYWNPVVDSAAVKIDADFTGNNPNIFTNNIVYSKTKQLVYMKNDTMQCDNNIYWVENNGASGWKHKKKEYQSLTEWQNNTGQEKHSRFADPMITNPGYHDRNFPVTQFNLHKRSPAIDAGIDVGNMGNRDFFGNAVPGKNGKYDIGAYEYGSKLLKDANKKIGATELAALNNNIQLKSYEGSTILLSFIDIDVKETTSQLAFIKSMQQQYAAQGLNIILIDASSNNKEVLANFIEDNELNEVAFITDISKEEITAMYNIKNFPTTFLVSKNGNTINEWKGITPVAALAMVIENDLGDALAVQHFNK